MSVIYIQDYIVRRYADPILKQLAAGNKLEAVRAFTMVPRQYKPLVNKAIRDKRGGRE